ncbi:MAG TPA: hypothetical protein VFA00_03585 [Actinomycetota bacterium]|nr:hypothetical protein [Actinomycetota bacterium]
MAGSTRPQTFCLLWFHSLMQPENAADVVRAFLRGQNYEQVGKVDEAIELYEAAVAAEFDSSGPYDRLIHLYADTARHRDVVRVAEAAIAKVHTYEDKKAWYEQMRAEAIKAQKNVPRAAPKKPSE